MLKVQEFLNQYSLDALVEKYAIHVNRHKKYPNLVQLKYDQIDSPMSKDIVKECRGIILDENDGWKVISYPFSKFFNYDEGQANKIDWKTARVYEKLDGSLMTLYFYDNAWQISSSGLPDASGAIKDQPFNFADLFWTIWEKQGYVLPTDTRYCYIFEMQSPYTQIIVPQTEGKISLIGVRNLNTLKEESPEMFLASWEIPKTFPVTSIEMAIERCQEMNPMKMEGFVIVDGNFNRVKIKSPQYMCLGLINVRDPFSMDPKLLKKYMLEIVRVNEGSEFLSYMPKFTALYNEVKVKYDALVLELETKYAEIKDIEQQGKFAAEANKTRYPTALYSLRAKKAKSVKQYLIDVNIKNVLEAVFKN